MKYCDRKTNKIIEQDNKTIKFLYNTVIGRIILKPLVMPIVSKINGKILNTRISTLAIPRFIKKNKINMTEYESKKYKSFNDFFTRKIKPENRPLSNNKELLTSIADSKLTVYDINNELLINVKNSIYSLEELLKEPLSKKYEGGKVLVFRLGVDDYHHYNFPDDGQLIRTKAIKGKLHTVNPIAYDTVKVWKENQRVVSFLKTENLKEVIQIEVGALNVGTIHNYNQPKFKKGEEKGFFSFGGSTIILILKKNIIEIDKDIEENSKKQIETRVLLNEIIGKIRKRS